MFSPQVLIGKGRDHSVKPTPVEIEYLDGESAINEGVQVGLSVSGVIKLIVNW